MIRSERLTFPCDLQFKNITNSEFQLHLWLDNKRLRGSLLSSETFDKNYEVYEDYHRFQQEIWGGYTRHNALRRKIYNSETSEEVEDELITENHAIMMYSPLVDSGS